MPHLRIVRVPSHVTSIAGAVLFFARRISRSLEQFSILTQRKSLDVPHADAWHVHKTSSVKEGKNKPAGRYTYLPDALDTCAGISHAWAMLLFSVNGAHEAPHGNCSQAQRWKTFTAQAVNRAKRSPTQ